MYTDNALLFPEEAIPILKEHRGWQWQQLVQRMEELPAHHEERLAFMLFMMRLNGCMDCETDCYRAMRGCRACSLQSLRRYKGSDEELIASFEEALIDIQDYTRVDTTQPELPEQPVHQNALPFALTYPTSAARVDVSLTSIT